MSVKFVLTLIHVQYIVYAYFLNRPLNILDPIISSRQFLYNISVTKFTGKYDNLDLSLFWIPAVFWGIFFLFICKESTCQNKTRNSVSDQNKPDSSYDNTFSVITSWTCGWPRGTENLPVRPRQIGESLMNTSFFIPNKNKWIL